MNRSRSIIIGLLLLFLVAVVAVSVLYTLRTRINASQAKDSFDHKFTISSVRPLSLCETLGMGSVGKQHIFVKVQDSNGEGINGISVKIQWDKRLNDSDDGFLVAETETKTNLRGQLESGRLTFAMFKGNYWVQLLDGDDEISGVVGPLQLGYYITENDRCGEVELADGSMLYYPYEVIFTQHQ